MLLAAEQRLCCRGTCAHTAQRTAVLKASHANSHGHKQAVLPVSADFKQAVETTSLSRKGCTSCRWRQVLLAAGQRLRCTRTCGRRRAGCLRSRGAAGSRAPPPAWCPGAAPACRQQRALCRCQRLVRCSGLTCWHFSLRLVPELCTCSACPHRSQATCCHAQPKGSRDAYPLMASCCISSSCATRACIQWSGQREQHCSTQQHGTGPHLDVKDEARAPKVDADALPSTAGGNSSQQTLQGTTAAVEV